ncbi:MAG: hypothetical protein WD029_06435 [Microthrixaceae bacterium]
MNHPLRKPFLHPEYLRGANLRYCLLTLLSDSVRPRTITELRVDLERLGLNVGGSDPNKVIADVLRYELGLGRVRRTGRGRYESGFRPNTTVRRHRARLRDLVAKSIENRKSEQDFSL